MLAAVTVAAELEVVVEVGEVVAAGLAGPGTPGVSVAELVMAIVMNLHPKASLFAIKGKQKL